MASRQSCVIESHRAYSAVGGSSRMLTRGYQERVTSSDKLKCSCMANVMIAATDPTNTATAPRRFNKTHVFETAIKKN